MTKADYESMTVPELKEMAELQGVLIPSDARKGDIIEALAALEAEGKAESETPEGKNVYEYLMSSTETALCSPDDFWRIKLVS